MYALGLEQAGHEVIGFCEVDNWAKRVLKKHWPTKPISSDILLLNKKLTELLVDSHAKTLALPAGVEGYSAIAPEKPQPVQDYSGKWLKPFAWYDLDSGLWKTWQQSFLTEWETFLGPWPPAGIMQNGIAWEREPLAHPIIAPEHTFLLTLAATDGKGTSRARYQGSQSSRVGRMSAQFRTSRECPTHLNPSFGEVVMGLPIGFTELETETPLASYEN